MKLKIEMARDAPEGTPFAHQALKSNVTGDRVFCAYSHCVGECGLPALFLKYAGPEVQGAFGPPFSTSESPVTYEFKAHGSMVACGPVWQHKRWEGERVYLPDEYSTREVFGIVVEVKGPRRLTDV